MTDEPRARRFASASVARVALIGVAALALGLRVFTIAEPLGIDQSLWASAVRGLSRGQRLYADVWEQRPPGIYLTYWLAFRLFGWVTATVAWMDVLASVGMTALLYALARMLSGRTAAAVAACLYATMTMPMWLYRYNGFLERSVSETFIVLCVGLSALAAVRLQRGSGWGASVALGLASSGAVLFKPNAGVYGLALFAWAMLAHQPARRTDRLRQFLTVGAAAAVLPLLTIAGLWRLDLLAEARTAVIDFNRWYVSAGFSPVAFLEAFSDAIFLRLRSEPLWLAAAVALVLAAWDLIRARRLSPLGSLALVWGAAGALAIIVNGIRLFNAYFIQVLPPLTLLVTWWLTTAWSAGRTRRILGGLTLVLMATLLVRRHYVQKVYASVRADAAALSAGPTEPAYLERFGGYANGRGYSARANAELGAYVASTTGPEERIYLFGINGAGVYFLADRLTAHRFLRVNFFVPEEFPDPAFTLRAVVRDLQQVRPRLLIFEDLHLDSAIGDAAGALLTQPLVQDLLAEYDLEAQIEDFAVYRRR